MTRLSDLETSLGLANGGPTGVFLRMLAIRRFEERAARLFQDNSIPGDLHLSDGQEGIAVGVCHHLAKGDLVTGSHRSHGIALARGLPLEPVLAELMGRAGGVCRGYGGSMHLTSLEDGFLGAFPVVGAGTPIAVGAALSAAHLRPGAVAVSFFGDGAFNQGSVLESLNLAAVWRLPVLFVLENNRWAETTSTRRSFAIEPLSVRGAGFGMPSATVDGQSVDEVMAAAGEAIARARQGAGPSLIECVTDRFRGHYEGDQGGYRTPAEVEIARQRDPLILHARRHGIGVEEISRLDAAIAEALEQAVEQAKAQPMPPVDEMLRFAGPREALA